MKTLGILLLAVVVGFSLLIAYQKSNAVSIEKARLEQEIYQKLLAEERLEKANRNIRNLQSSLGKAEDQIANTESLLKQTVKLNDDLKVRLDRASIVQQKLNEKIEAIEALSRKEELTVVSPNDMSE